MLAAVLATVMHCARLSRWTWERRLGGYKAIRLTRHVLAVCSHAITIGIKGGTTNAVTVAMTVALFAACTNLDILCSTVLYLSGRAYPGGHNNCIKGFIRPKIPCTVPDSKYYKVPYQANVVAR